MINTLADAPQSALSGVARVLVHAGKLSSKAAEDLVKSAKERKLSFIASVIALAVATPPPPIPKADTVDEPAPEDPFMAEAPPAL